MNVTTGSFTISIGNPGLSSDTNTIRIGTNGIHTATFIAGISGAPIAGVAVGITADGQLGVSTSSARYKEAIEPMNDASDVILSLKPMTFHYKKDLDPKVSRSSVWWRRTWRRLTLTWWRAMTKGSLIRCATKR